MTNGSNTEDQSTSTLSTGAIADDEIEQWFDEEDEESKESTPSPQVSPEEKYTQSQLRVVRSNMDFSLHMLKDSSSREWINRAPDYQRRHRWDSVKRSLLIESVLMNIPIPPLFLYENEYNQYEVMDGRQRLDTVIGFLNNDFPLRGLEFWSELNNKKFDELPLTIQRGLLRRTISAIVLLAETSLSVTDDDDIRMVMFRRLNTGGASLNPQELRNALYPGLFNKAVRDLARSDPFTAIWSIPPKLPDEDSISYPALTRNPLYKTMADAELVLRVFSIKEMITDGHRGSLRKLLDNTLKRHMIDNKDIVDKNIEIFTSALIFLSSVFEGAPFRLPGGRLSRPLYDALMVSRILFPVATVEHDYPAIRRALADALEDNTKYDILTGRGNTTDAIEQRVKLATEILAAR